MTLGVVGLTSFQRDLLMIAAGQEQPSGQEIKEAIQAVYNTEITHGRLYPNLDSLADEGYVEKGEINRRTNFYQVTDEGLSAISDYVDWQLELLPDGISSTTA